MIQYLYPSGDSIGTRPSSSGFLNESSTTVNLFNSIKDGVLFPNDSTYIRANALDMSGTAYIFTMTNEVSVIPNNYGDIKLRVRFKNDDPSTIIYSDSLGLSKAGLNDTAEPDFTNNGIVYFPYTTGVWVDMDIPLVNTYYGLSEQLNTGAINFNSGRFSSVHLTIHNSGAAQTQPISISEMEVISSGDYIYQPAYSCGLYVQNGTQNYDSLPFHTLSHVSIVQEKLPFQFYPSKVHESGSFKQENIFTDAFFEFDSLPTVETGVYNIDTVEANKRIIFPAKIGGGNMFVYSPDSGVSDLEYFNVRYEWSPTSYSGILEIGADSGTLYVKCHGAGGAGGFGAPGIAGDGGGGGGYCENGFTVANGDKFFYQIGAPGNAFADGNGGTTIFSGITVPVPMRAFGGKSGFDPTLNKRMGGVASGGTINLQGYSGQVYNGTTGGNGGTSADGMNVGGLGATQFNNGNPGGIFTGGGNGGGGAGSATMPAPFGTFGGSGGGGYIEFLYTGGSFVTLPTSGWSQIFNPGHNKSNIYNPTFSDNLTYTDGTSARMSSDEVAITTGILPEEGHYSLLLSMYGGGKWSEITNSPNSFLPSGLTVIFDSCRLIANGDNTVSFNFSNLGLPSPYNSSFPYQDYIVSYDGKYNVWGCSFGVWNKLLTSSNMDRASITNPEFYSAQYGSGLDTSVIVRVPNALTNLADNRQQIGIQRIGVVNSGITNAEVNMMSLSQSGVNLLLSDSSEHPDSYVQYRSLLANKDINSYSFDGINSYEESFLPYGTIRSGTINSSFIDNVGNYSYVPVYELESIVSGTFFNPGFIQAWPSSGLAKVYDYPADAITYSGWIDSEFDGDFLISVSKDATEFNSDSNPFPGGGGVTTSYEYRARYKVAYDILNITSGNHLYVQKLGNLIECNYNEEAFINTPEVGIPTSSVTIEQLDGGVDWNGAVVKTLNALVPFESGIVEHSAKIHNATFLAYYISPDASGFYNSTTLYTVGAIDSDSGIPLFCEGSETEDSSIELFMQCPTPIDKSMQLFCRNDEGNEEGISLYIESQPDPFIPLFIKALDPTDSVTGIPLFLEHFVGNPNSGYIPLWMQQTQSAETGVTLYINAENAGVMTKPTTLFLAAEQIISADYRSLFVSGPSPSGKALTFFMNSQNPPVTSTATLHIRHDYKELDNAQVPLLIHNTFSESGSLSFHTIAGINQSVTPLVVIGPEPEEIGRGTTLSIVSTETEGAYFGMSNIPLFLGAKGSHASIPLFIKNHDEGQKENNIPLYVQSEYPAAANSVTLYVESVHEDGNGVKFFTAGNGENVGAIVDKNSIPLFIDRGNDVVGDGISMIVNGPSGEFDSVSFYLNGGTLSNGQTTLFMPDAVGSEDKPSTMYVHGF